jgi:hypothetical protein
MTVPLGRVRRRRSQHPPLDGIQVVHPSSFPAIGGRLRRALPRKRNHGPSVASASSPRWRSFRSSAMPTIHGPTSGGFAGTGRGRAQSRAAPPRNRPWSGSAECDSPNSRMACSPRLTHTTAISFSRHRRAMYSCSAASRVTDRTAWTITYGARSRRVAGRAISV